LRSICCLWVCLCIPPKSRKSYIISRQRLCKHFPAATYTHVEHIVLYAVRVWLKGRTRLVFSRNSYNILPPTVRSSYWALSFWLLHKILYAPCVLCALPISSSFTWSFYYIWLILHYAVFSSLLTFHLSSVQIFSSVSCSPTPSVLCSSLTPETHTELQNINTDYPKYYSFS
jgi:hypothetical protein